MSVKDTTFASPTDQNILEILENTSEPMTTRDVADACDRPRSTAYDALSRLHDAGHIHREKHGNTIEWIADSPTPQRSPASSDHSGPTHSNSSLDQLDTPAELDGSTAQEIRESLGLSALETTEAGNIYLSELTAWEAGDIELQLHKKKAIASFLANHTN